MHIRNTPNPDEFQKLMITGGNIIPSFHPMQCQLRGRYTLNRSAVHRMACSKSSQNTENVNYHWLFFKIRQGQLSCLLFGFLHILAFTHRELFFVDHYSVVKPAQKGIKYFCLTHNKRFSGTCRVSGQTYSLRVMWRAAFFLKDVIMRELFWLTEVIKASYEICLIYTFARGSQTQSLHLATKTSR